MLFGVSGRPRGLLLVLVLLQCMEQRSCGCSQLWHSAPPGVAVCFPTPGRGLPYGSGLGLSRCLGPGECLHSFIHLKKIYVGAAASAKKVTVARGLAPGWGLRPNICGVGGGTGQFEGGVTADSGMCHEWCLVEWLSRAAADYTSAAAGRVRGAGEGAGRVQGGCREGAGRAEGVQGGQVSVFGASRSGYQLRHRRTVEVGYGTRDHRTNRQQYECWCRYLAISTAHSRCSFGMSSLSTSAIVALLLGIRLWAGSGARACGGGGRKCSHALPCSHLSLHQHGVADAL